MSDVSRMAARPHRACLYCGRTLYEGQQHVQEFGSDYVRCITVPAKQEDFFEAVRSDPEISPEDRAYWLSMEPKKEIGMEGLTEGRIVHYVLDDGHHRPAIVVHVWRTGTPDGLVPPENGVCQLQVFTDSDPEGKFNDGLPQVMWKTSVVYEANGKPGTWHWIEKA